MLKMQSLVLMNRARLGEIKVHPPVLLTLRSKSKIDNCTIDMYNCTYIESLNIS
jgi:hypothetical protein